jgi:hypothetical protein
VADIFISYARADIELVHRMADALESQGFSVWWDREIQPGAHWDEEIQRNIQEAKCCIVVWSRESTASDHVKAEATLARNLGKFLPVAIGAVEPPLPFASVQTENLRGWSGDTSDPSWRRVVERAHLVSMAGAPRPRTPPSAALPPGGGAILRSPASYGDDLSSPAPARAGCRNTLLRLIMMALVLAGGVAAVALLNLREDPAKLSGVPPSVVVQGGGVAPPANCSEGGEKASWEKAKTEKSRAAYTAYLASYPNCPNAQRARDILATSCKVQTTEVWKSSPMFQSNRAVVGIGASCAAAKKDANRNAQNYCEEFVQSGGFRNAQWKVSDQDCTSEQVSGGVTMYRADLAASCTWEQAVPEETEVCG